jgi:hypothetical protein
MKAAIVLAPSSDVPEDERTPLDGFDAQPARPLLIAFVASLRRLPAREKRVSTFERRVEVDHGSDNAGLRAGAIVEVGAVTCG